MEYFVTVLEVEVEGVLEGAVRLRDRPAGMQKALVSPDRKV